MYMTTLEKVQQLDDFKALRLFRHIEAEMVQQLDAELDNIFEHLPAEFTESPDFDAILEADESAFDQPLDSGTAIAVARQSLDWMAQAPDTAAYLDDKLENWKDNEMVAGTILAVGGALSAVMIMGTFRMGYSREKGFDFSIGFRDKEQLEPVKILFGSLLQILKPGQS